MMKKKGELTTQQIVMIVILLASFAVLLYFFVQLNLGEETESEICHNSVILRSKALAASTVPLNCKRQYICISADGTCEKMTEPEVVEVKSRDEIYETLAESLADCWWMFGEGKVDYVGEDLASTHHCSICGQIAFDNSVFDLVKSRFLSQEDFFRYLDKNEVSEGLSYSEYLYGAKMGSIQTKDASIEFKDYDLNSQYYSMMGVRSEISDWVIIGGVTTIVVGGIFLAPIWGVAAITGGILVGAGTAGGAYYYLAPVITGENGQEFTRPSLIKVNSLDFENLKCESIATKI